VVFLAVFQGDQLRAKVRKICEGLAVFFLNKIILVMWSCFYYSFFEFDTEIDFNNTNEM